MRYFCIHDNDLNSGVERLKADFMLLIKSENLFSVSPRKLDHSIAEQRSSCV